MEESPIKLQNENIKAAIYSDLNALEDNQYYTEPFDQVMVNDITFEKAYLFITQYDIFIKMDETNFNLAYIPRQYVTKFSLKKQEILEEKVTKVFF